MVSFLLASVLTSWEKEALCGEVLPDPHPPLSSLLLYNDPFTFPPPSEQEKRETQPASILLFVFFIITALRTEIIHPGT